MAETFSSAVWTVKTGEEDTFVAAWKEFVGWAATMPGSGTFRLVRDLEDPSRFLSFAPWERAEAARAWQQHPDFPEQLSRPRGHCQNFEPSGYELAAEVS